MAKTTKTQRDEIVTLYNSGKDSTEIAKMYNVTKSAIVSLLKRRQVKMRKSGGERRKYKNINEYFFSTQTERAAYWAGFIAADGNIYQSKMKNAQLRLVIELSRMDESHLEKFDIGTEIYYRTPSNKRLGNDMCAKGVSSNKICKDLEKYNITPNKTLTLEFPKSLDYESIRHFIRGNFDGDGCFYINKKNYGRYILLGPKNFLIELAKHIPCKSSITPKKGTRIWKLEIYHRESKKFYNYLYNNCSVYLNRKKEKAENLFSAF